MRLSNLFLTAILILVTGFSEMSFSKNFIQADNLFIQYFGRWDNTDPLHPKYSWPGVYLYAEFSGTSIGIKLNDKISYYNIYIDGEFYKIFHGTLDGEAEYILAENLEDKNHTFLFSKRNISFDDAFTFGGIILDDNARLLPPPQKLSRKIEFIGDSFTAAESNEATVQQLEWEARFPVTNIDKGFAPLIAKHFNAQYATTCRSGCGMVCDWRGDFEVSIPKIFDRTLMEVSEPKWDFKKWIPELVVVCLGLNDHSGLRDEKGNISEEKSELFRKGYHNFVDLLRNVYPNTKIVAVAAFDDWIRKNVKQVVDEESTSGMKDIFYSQFDRFEGGYVANGHPTVETHRKMADQIIESIESFGIFKSGN